MKSDDQIAEEYTMKTKQQNQLERKTRAAIMIDDQLNTQYVYLGLGVKNVKLGIRLMWLLVTRHYLNKEYVRQKPRCFIIAIKRLSASLWYSIIVYLLSWRRKDKQSR